METIQVLINGDLIECTLVERHGRSEALFVDPLGNEFWAHKVKGVWVSM